MGFRRKSSGASSKFCAWFYLIQILKKTEKLVYYRKNGKLIGIAGYSKNNSKKYILRKKLCGLIIKRMYRSHKIKNLKAFMEYQHDYDYVPDSIKNYFDGELLILIVDDSYRGKGIGKKLLTQIFELAKNDKMKNIQILTDDSCNYAVYEKLGCKRIYETIIENKEYASNKITKEEAYIYEKKLN